MTKVNRLAGVFVGALFLFSGVQGFASPSLPPNPKSEDLLQPSDLSDGQSSVYSVFDETKILREEHSLFELIEKDPEKNLVYLHPSIAMTAPQRVASWIHFGGVKRIAERGYGNGSVNYYPIFSDGLPEARGKAINGQDEAIQNFANYVFAAARGDGSASKMLLLVGPAGTGKSYFLSILSNVAETLSATHPDYFVYTYEWKDLKKYPSLYPALNIQDQEDGTSYEHPFPCPIHESPLNLIPDTYVKTILKLVSDRVVKLSQSKVKPRRYHCPHCQEIRIVILKKYMEDHGLEKLTPFQEVEALAPHVRIKRLVIGSNGTMAKLDAEPKDVDFQGLLTSPNAFVFQSFGQQHPMSYYLSGKILRSNGSLLVMDEFFRDDEGFRDQALNLIEEKKVRRGGAPEVELDTLVIGASNHESIEKVTANEAAKAHLDRTLPVRMPYLLNPLLEARNLLMMKNLDTVLMQKLAGASESGSSDIVPARVEDLFPLPKVGETPVGPDHRYKLWFDVGPGKEPVHLSPHALMYIAMTVTGSRLETDPRKALAYGEKAVIKDAAFRDVFTRLQILMKRYTSINASDLGALRSLSQVLKEGDEGISERDAANAWLTSAIAEAQLPGNGNCLTPELVQKVFLRLLDAGTIRSPNIKTRALWITINNDMMNKYVVPSFQNDVSTALGAGLGAVNSMYDEIVQEILALSDDDDAKTYQTENGEDRPINRERLKEIAELYVQAEKRAFNFGEVIAARARNKGVQHQGLLTAVKSYLAKRSTDLVTFDEIQRASDQGSSEVRQKRSELNHVLTHELGYCDHCLKSALMQMRTVMSRTESMK